MKYEKYDTLVIAPDFLEYRFISNGPKGDILKIVQFAPTNIPNLYHLAFGNQKYDGDLDDLSVSDNKDRNKILCTVVEAIHQFFTEYPNMSVFFSGSTNERTRLYRMAITINIEELSRDFEISGMIKDSNSIIYIPFEKDKNYLGFVIRKKYIF